MDFIFAHFRVLFFPHCLYCAHFIRFFARTRSPISIVCRIYMWGTLLMTRIHSWLWQIGVILANNNVHRNNFTSIWRMSVFSYPLNTNEKKTHEKWICVFVRLQFVHRLLTCSGIYFFAISYGRYMYDDRLDRSMWNDRWSCIWSQYLTS